MTKKSLIKKLKDAKHPEDLFSSRDAVRDEFRDYAKLLHPDKNPNDKAAAEAFKTLNEFKELADLKLGQGTWGNKSAITKPIKLATKKASYVITGVCAQGDYCQVYEGTSDVKDSPNVVVKVVRNPANNDLLANEAKQLHFMHTASPMKGKATMKHVPILVDSFVLNQGKANKQIVVLQKLDGYVSLADVLKAYPNGLDLGDVAWIFNRLLGALMTVHQAGLVHAAVIPPHFMIHPASHNGVLIDWSYCVASEGTVKAVSPMWTTYYPDEVLEKRRVSPGTDLFMAANLFVHLVGGDWVGRKLPAKIPKPIQGLIRACWLSQRHRSSDAFELFEDFRRALQDIYGKPKFRPFPWPVAAAT